jgi:hypothetical protein
MQNSTRLQITKEPRSQIKNKATLCHSSCYPRRGPKARTSGANLGQIHRRKNSLSEASYFAYCNIVPAEFTCSTRQPTPAAPETPRR